MAFQYAFDEVLVFCGVYSIQRIIAGHYGTDTSFLYSIFEYREVNLVQSSFIYDRIGTMSPFFLVIGGKMLYCRHDPLVLESCDVAACNFRRKKRIFSIIFEISAAMCRTIDVDSGSKKNIYTSGLAVQSQTSTYFLRHCWIPGCCKRDSAWVECALGFISDTLRTVGHAY